MTLLFLVVAQSVLAQCVRMLADRKLFSCLLIEMTVNILSYMEESGTWLHKLKSFVMIESDNPLSRRSAAAVPFKTFRCGYINLLAPELFFFNFSKPCI